MVTDTQIKRLNLSFKRLFALPISRMTLRELQNALNETFPEEKDVAQDIYSSLLTGKVANEDKEEDEELNSFIRNYTTNVLIAKEVAELGEFLNSFSCDFVQQGNQLLFANRMRRIDGEEYHFMSQPDTNVRLGHMFINRLRDLKRTSGGRLQLNPILKEELKNLINDIEDLLEEK